MFPGIMARHVRVEYANAVYHVTARGNDRKAIYRDGADRQQWSGREIRPQRGRPQRGKRVEPAAFRTKVQQKLLDAHRLLERRAVLGAEHLAPAVAQEEPHLAVELGDDGVVLVAFG